MEYSRTERLVALAISSATDVFDTDNVNLLLLDQQSTKTRTRVEDAQWKRLFVRELTRLGVEASDQSVVDAVRRFESDGIYQYEPEGFVTYNPSVFWTIYGPVLDEINKSRND